MNIKYRPEIDGLRALAVASVILYHAQLNIFNDFGFKGGFIGVDIFFVISGYLITSIILRELFSTKILSLKKFYERRVRRILPALMIVMIFTLPFAWIFLIPNSFIEYSKSILYSLGFGSNFFFYFLGQIYGEESGLLKPFLHTWSLSIEEQFYILFPVLILFIFKYFPKYLLFFLILFFILSLVISDYGSRNYPSFNFYTIQSRAWEILAGSIMAYYEIKLGRRGNNKFLPSIGLILILSSIFLFNDQMFHPSIITFLPIIGVCFIIWFSNKDEIIFRILSSKILVGIGLISYSLYLWHYPIFAFSRIIDFSQGSNLEKILLIIFTILISILTYLYVEKFYRNKKINFRIILIHLSIAFIFLIFVNITIVNQNGFKERFPSILQSSFGNPLIKLKKFLVPCHNNQECEFNEKAIKKVVIVGDSHVAPLIYDLKNRSIKNNFGFKSSTYNGCLFFPGMNKVNRKTNKIDSKCTAEYFSELENNLLIIENKIIIFGGKYLNYFYNEVSKNENDFKNRFLFQGTFKNNESSFKQSLKKIAKNNKIIIIYPIPFSLDIDVPKKLVNILPKKKDEIEKFLVPENYLTTSYSKFIEENNYIFKILDNIKDKNIFRIYPHTLFCDTLVKDRCLTHDNKDIYYSDNNHLSLEGAKLVNELLIKKIDEIFEKN